jgi:UDP-N-acetyl-D-glucosamine dehydrogenase
LEKLLKAINDKSALIGIVGMGYVGLPLGLAFNRAGFKVLGFDIDENKIKSLNKGQSYIQHIGSEGLSQAVKANQFEATVDFSRANEPDALLICVPTPLDKHLEPDLSYVVNTIKTLAPHLRAGQYLSLESTTYPGTTEEEILPHILKRGFIPGQDFFVGYSPEREDPGNPNFETKTIPKVVGGVTPNCLEVGKQLYEQAIAKVVPVSSPRAAEMTKLLENIYRAVNIGLVNELKMVADRMNIDIHEVIKAASSKPFGFKAFYPGPGLGGHCIPIDPFYLTWKAKEYGVHTRFIELAGQINNNMPQYVVEKTVSAMNNQGKALKGSKILILGIAYKKNVDDMRESPALEIIELLEDRGAFLDYSDPHIPAFPKTRRMYRDMTSVPLTPETISNYDCLLLVTDHDDYNYDLILEHAKCIVDSRGVYGDHEKVVKA